ncbi:MAG: glutathione S-transferase family protein [Peptoniphilaceae bacterium]|nr:glutathione S-transferase family protein [Peptoniphilaceae bacterium]MDY6018786.1 glutathione S-transferase family protein [Anaerococcus sp.]
MKLYYAPGTCAVAVWIALDWLGCDYEVERVVLGSDEYRKINPAGAVPALDTGDGKIKTQAGSILSYLVEKYKDQDLGPDDSLEDRYLFNEIVSFLSADYHPAFWPMFSPDEFTTSSDEKDYENIKEAAYKNIDSLAQSLDKRLEGKTHIYKNKKTVLDAYAYILSRWLKNTPKSWQEYPNLKKFMETMENDSNVQRIVHESVKKN